MNFHRLTLALITLPCIILGTIAIDPKEKKQFLETPVFAQTYQYKLYKETLALAKDKQKSTQVLTPSIPLTPAKSKEEVEKKTSTEAKKSVAPKTKNAEIPSSVPKPQTLRPLPNPHCGFTPYTRNYCAYEAPNFDTILCTETSGKCLKRYLNISSGS